MARIVTFAVILMFTGPVSAKDSNKGMSTVAQHEAGPSIASQADLIVEGASVYRNQCTRCHGRNGEGQQYGHDAAPRLHGILARLSVRRITVQVIQGGSYMPPFSSLTDRKVAAVATYIRNSFGNNHGIATEEEVAEHR
ncbi:MAG: c-type cytochrome [Proteobacteria bacterium]|jgi:mono/diheme cytochrome c family protein|nr:c-type cytochrome [Pseudomonadota bacterium]